MSRGTPSIAIAATTLLLAACTSDTRIYEGYDPGMVWQAMVTAAQEPRYPDWKVTANDVWVDEKEYRIEVLRLVRRVYFQPTAPAHHEDRTWRFEMRLKHTEPPEARFVSRGFGMPTEAQAEALRYFADVESVLLKLPEPAPPESDREVMDSMGIDEMRPEAVGRPAEPGDDDEPE